MFSFAHAADAAPQVAPQGDIFTSLLPLVFLFGIFYFIVIRPQQKQAKAHKIMLAELKKGDKVVTAGGFIVTIEKVEDTHYTVKMNNDMSCKLTRESVAKKYEEA